jgi:hypothetical protein
MADAVAGAESRLYGLPLEDFTKERDALARELRKGGDKEAAATVAKLPKPTPVGWAVNRLARDEPDLIDALAQAGERLREVQLGGEGREALREAVAGERAAVEAVVTAARDLKPGGRALSRAMTDRLRTTLHAAAGDEELRERILTGRVAAEAEAGGAWPLGAAPAPAPGRAAKPPRRAKGATRDRDAEARAAAAEREAAARAAEEREAEQREAAERRELEKRLKTARNAAARAAKRLDTARTDAESAQEGLEAARQADEAARDEVARLEERLG